METACAKMRKLGEINGKESSEVIMTAKNFAWPGNRRIAIAVTAMVETWSEGKAPPYYHAAKASGLKSGIVDSAGVAWANYGPKVGVYRIINLLRENRIRGTFCVNGRTAELFPEAVRQIAKSGHEIAAHAYVQDQLMSYMTPDEERATIVRCLDLLEKTSGSRPKGWISPTMAFSENTRALLAEARLLWDGDARDADLPSVVETKHGKIVHVPGSNHTDVRAMESSSRDLWDIYKEGFDYLYKHEAPAFLVMSIHCHFGGRPLIAAVFDKLFKYMASYPDVWFASYDEIAQWVYDNGLHADPRMLLKA
jgi:allantoinase